MRFYPMRDEFPIFGRYPELVYFDSAATTHKPRCVIEALSKFYREEYATVHRAIYQSALKATEKYHETRQYVAKFLSASSDEVIFNRSTTEGINFVAQSYGKTFLKPGDEILISEMEHHSNIVPWQLIAKETGAILKAIPVNEQGVLEWEGWINAKTKIVSVAHISNVTGTINPIARIAQEAHAKGAILLVDGAQGAPYLKVDVQALECDFYAFSGHKCYGPTGIGVLFGKRDLLEAMPPIQGGGDMIEEVTFDKTTYQKPPLRFEAGTPIIAEVVALKTALEFIDKHRQKPNLEAYARKKLQEEIPGIKILGTASEKGPILSFYFDKIHSLDIATLLDVKNIAIRSGHLCAQPLLKKFGLQQVARASFGLYNTKQEIDFFVDSLKEVVDQCYIPAPVL